MRDAHFSIGAVSISGAGQVGACRTSTINQGDESCHDGRMHGDYLVMYTA